MPRLVIAGLSLQAIKLDNAAVSTADCVVVVTDHAFYDWTWIADQSQLIVDTRNAIGKTQQSHVIRL